MISYLNHIAAEAALRPQISGPGYQAVRNWKDAETYFRERPRSVDNLMVRILSGMAFPPGHCTDAILDAALHNLDAMAAFGVQEHLAESLVLMRRKMQWRVLPVVSRRKSGNPARIVLTARDRAFFAELNEYDLRLYRHARARIEAEIRGDRSVAFWARVSRAATPAMTRAEDTLRRIAGRRGRVS